jgi:cyclopropane fatty-acyl-phospholipid synthase-like methyltransferase
MSTWTAGYVADINYTHGFYRELAPALLAFTALLKRQRAPDLAGPLTYCELGCGQGFSANLLAAANPNVEFHANDFNPAQIAGAQALAAEGEAPNVHFSDASFQEYIDDPALPDFDIITLHGIYSWVSAENRAAIVAFIRKKLKVGGLVYISYNTLPGWASAMPLRRLFADHAATTGGPLASRIEKALVFAERFSDANPAYFRDVSGVKQRLEKIKEHNRAYLAHEYFNKDWTPLYFADVAADMAEAKLGFLGSAHIPDHVDGINFTPQHLAMLNEVADPIFRETVRDYTTLNQFRRDVFVRGAVALPAGEVLTRLAELRLALSVPREGFNLKINGPLGDVQLQEEVYAPVLDALASGPKTVRQLVAVPEINALGDVRLEEAIRVLVGTGNVQPCLDAKGDAKRAARTKAFNLAVMKRAVWSHDLQSLASPVTGGGIHLDRFAQIFLLAQHEKHADPAQYALGLLLTQGQKLLKDGKALETDEENLAELRARYAVFQTNLPLLQQLGIA